jgi:5-methylcytosine-specific restriction endonuclease McrA
MHANGVLVLNKNWVAIHVCSLERAIGLLVQDLASVVCEDYQTHDFDSWRALSMEVEAEGNRFIQAPNFRLMRPEVILLHTFSRVPPRAVKFNRRNIYLRDGCQCQYCGTKPAREDLTIDHVIPRSKGGRSVWENVVVACQACNARKGNRLLPTIAMNLARKPKKPHWMMIVRHTMRDAQRPLWEKFVDKAYWNAELDMD